MAKKIENLSALEAIIDEKIPTADCYILCGVPDLCQPLLQIIRNHYLTQEDAEFNLDIFDCQESPELETIVNSLREMPVMCEKRLLILQNAHALSKASAKTIAEAMSSNLPYHGNAICIVSQNILKDSLANLATNDASYISAVFDCSLRESERERWISYQLKHLGLTASTSIVRQISEYTGGDTNFLQTQIEKLRQYLGTETEIKSADIKAVMRKSLEVKSWELTEAIRKKDLKSAWNYAQNILCEEGGNRSMDIIVTGRDEGKASERTMGALSYINTYLCSIAELRHLVKEYGNDISKLAQLTGKKDYQIRKSLEELASWSDNSLRQAFKALCLADLNIKSGRDHLLAINLLLARLCMRNK